MQKSWIEKLTTWPAILVSGVFLLAERIPHVAGEWGGVSWAWHEALPLSPAWVTVVISGLPLVVSAARKLLYNKGLSRLSSALLITMAMVAAAAIGDVFAAGEVAFLMAVGERLEDLTTDRAKRGLERLLALAPTRARRLTDSGEELVDATAVQVGDRLLVLPGETIPVDGTVVAGEGAVNQAAITGESLPVDKVAGDEVYSGTLNGYGALTIEATRVGEDSTIRRLVRLVEQAGEQKAPTHRAADRWASLLVPVALLIAIVAGLVKQDLVTAVTVLVVFCPCALVLATPTAIMAAVGQATKHGILIKSGEALEAMGGIDTVAFDKTGTLTTGQLTVTDILPLQEGVNGMALLSMAAAVESHSEHPLGRAITDCAKRQGVSPATVTDFTMAAGRGVCAQAEGHTVMAGSEACLTEWKVPLPTVARTALDRLREEGKATVSVAVDGQVWGIIALADTDKPGAKAAVKALHKAGVDTVLLTGDHHRAATYIASQLGIGQVQAELLPQQKAETVSALQQKGHRVCMVGDGINDAPALKTAAVGVAMGAVGSDIAVDAADIALMGDDIQGLVYLRRLATATMATIRTAITLSLVINFVAIALSVLGWLTPTLGALVHNAGSVLVVLLAAGLYDRQIT